MNILYFYSEVMGYTLSVVKEIVRISGAQVHIVYWDNKKNTPFQNTEIPGVFYYKRSAHDLESLIQLYEKLQPTLVYVSGRMDKEYVRASRYIRKQGVPVVSGFDNQWKNNWKSFLTKILSPWLYKRNFDYLWVAGVRQYEYARKLGYSPEKIIMNVYSADTKLFTPVYEISRSQFKKRFVFTGRLEQVKGIEILLKAYDKFLSVNQEWELWIIGNGSLKQMIPVHSSIIVHEFLQPAELVKILEGKGVFVLPSIHEPWGVVLHEFAAAGFPIICSDCCGASTVFVQHNSNGFIFKTGNEDELLMYMKKTADASEERLQVMSNESYGLSMSISPEISARNFLEVLNR